ncbi:hypothetical protein BDB00DRAFT_755863, partial [Zychaea mexicana]|uniref:uncharacterized protein n=1 Tax=Zychaea mexicana TaxID=64656 RepID=UPI0022FF3B24
NNVSYQKAIKVVLYPAVGGFPSAWEFTLIVVVALLAVSFLASVGMHYHLWRIRRRQRLLYENGLLPPPFPQAFQVNSEKKVIDASMLTLFPTRTIGATTDININNDNNNNNNNNSIQPDSPIAVATQRRNSSQSHLAHVDDDSCVICLDGFSSGDSVRKLPCGHEYHCECIGNL